ncbi:MAG: glycosyltransferase [Myxococcota bacterium]|nr:glycosyltransferase [Myxococcota bacterium]MEC9388536.1 glycosyltransferase [Myxococcota bacterium]
MHILQVTPYFPPTWAYGGIPRIVDGLSRALVQKGHEVTVLTTDAYDGEQRSGLDGDRDHHGVRVLTVRNLSNRAAYAHQLFTPTGVREALNRLERNVDVMHLHGHRHLLNNAAVRWAAGKGVPYVLTANGTLLRHEQKVGIKWFWDQLVARRIPAGAAKLIAVSAADVARHRSAGIDAERIERIPNGLDLGEFEALPTPGAFRHRHGLGDGPVVTYLGRVSPRKGVEHLIRAFADGHLADAQLVIAGNDMGAMETALAEPRGANVHFAGLVEGVERLELLADTDVLVYPSADEVFGLVPFEGLLCGAPVVVADDCGCGELIAEAGAGLLVRYGDIDGIRSRVRTLLEDKESAQAMVGRGRRYVREQLGFTSIAERHVAVYERVAM